MKDKLHFALKEKMLPVMDSLTEGKISRRKAAEACAEIARGFDPDYTKADNYGEPVLAPERERLLQEMINHALGYCDCGEAEICSNRMKEICPVIGRNPDGTWREP